MNTLLRTLLLVALLVQMRAGAQTPAPTRIMPLGDSITFGSSVAGGYRNRLYQILTAAGYNVDFVGTQTGNGVGTLPDSDHQGIGGWRIDQLDSNIAGWFGAIADPDVILLHIGTNDFGQGLDTLNAINRLDALITKITALRPYAHLIVTNLMEREEPNNSAIQNQFNPMVQGRVQAQAALGRRVTYLDMRSAVPLSDMPDQLHPGQAGYDKMANTWLPAIQAVITPNGDSSPPAIVRAAGASDRAHVTITFSKPVADLAANLANYSLTGGLSILSAQLDAAKRSVTLVTSPQAFGATYTVTVNGIKDRTAGALALEANSARAFAVAIPRGYLNNVPESLGYTLAYSLDIPASSDFKLNQVPYTVDNHNGIGSFSRVAYYLELQQPDGALSYVWASMDAFTTDPGKLAVPTLASGALFQQNVTGLTVASNVSGIVTGEGLSGNLEFWPTNYAMENTPAPGVPGASDALFDFGDHPTPGNYGSMQLHNAAASQTIFAFNNWGGNATPGDLDLGIGNNPAPTNNGVDWTFAHNAAAYSVRSLQVLVQTTGDATAPTLVSAVASYGRGSITVTFSEPLAPGSVASTNFSLNGGVLILGASLAVNQRDVVLSTSAQPIGTSLTLQVSGVRDTSPSANRITANSTIAVSAPALPAEITANVGAPAANYQLVYSLNIPATGNFNVSPNFYAFDERNAPGFYNRVAYYMELQKPGEASQFVWASMDAFSTDKTKIGVPTLASTAIFQQAVTNLDVISNVAGVVNGTGMPGGNLEFWPTNYTAVNGVPVPGASDTNFDFGDTRTAGAHGSMQLHNAGAAQTLFAMNNWGADGNPLAVGIGNNPAPVNAGVDWTFAANAGTYSKKILHVLVLPAVAPGVTPVPEVVANVPEAANYQLVYSMNIPATGNFNNTTGVFTVDSHLLVGAFSRVAYYLELQKSGEPAPTYIWTSMDAFTSDPVKIAIPTAASGASFQQNVTNLNVVSNAPGIVTGTGMSGGNIEFWPGNYTQANGNAVPNASAATFDFGDTRTAGTGYGSMQVHNHDAAQTLFALNHWGVNGNPLCLGIGNRPATDTDWTFADNVTTYDVKRVLRIFVLPGSAGDTTGPVLAGAKGSISLNRLVVSFNEPLADSAAAAANFTISGGLSITGATLLPGQREVVLTTTPQTAGTVYTIGATGIRDRSAGNLILPGATIQFTPPATQPFLANIPEAAGYNLVYKLAIADSSAYNSTGVPYSIDESKFPQSQPFDRIAYCLELQLAGGGASSWVYVSADAFTTRISEAGVPAAGPGVFFQSNLANLNVFASDGAPVTKGIGLTGGNIEFWFGDYSAPNGAGVLNASATNYDFGDTRTAGIGYGSMQIHNHDASETIFAFNNWGGKGGNNDLGIGNDPAPVTLGVDWTFHHNAAVYSTKNLYVLVRPGGNAGGPILLSQPLPRTLAVGASTTLAISAGGTGPFTYQWRFNGAPVAGATASWLDLTNLAASQAGTYDVLVTGSNGITSASQPALLTVITPANRAPLFGGYRFTTGKNVSALLSRASLLGKATDADADLLSITAVSSTSLRGGTVSFNASGVIYTPALDFLGADSFTLMIADGHGGTVTGTVALTITTAPAGADGRATLSRRFDGTLDLLFYGLPGGNYAIQRSIDLIQWSSLQTALAGDDGSVPFSDITPIPPFKAFYRIQKITP